MEEAAVGGVEEGDTEGEVGAHDPELALGGPEREVDVARLDGAPVKVQEDDGSKRQR